MSVWRRSWRASGGVADLVLPKSSSLEDLDADADPEVRWACETTRCSPTTYRSTPADNDDVEVMA